MKMKIWKRVFSFVFIINMLITTPFIVSATPPKTSKKHYHSYSEGGNRIEINLGRIIYNNKVEEYKKKGYEDGANNVPVRLNIPKGYLSVYEDEYKKGQLVYDKNKEQTKRPITETNVSFTDNVFCADEPENKDKTAIFGKNIVANKMRDKKRKDQQEKYDTTLEEYKKKGYEDGVNNISNKPYVPRRYRTDYNVEYERGQKEYVNRAIKKFGYEDGEKNRAMMDKIPESHRAIYECEYRKGLVNYMKSNLNNKTIDFGRVVPKTAQQAKRLGEMHGSNDVPYRTGGPEDIQEEYRKAYFSAQRNRLFLQGYHAAIQKAGKKSLKKKYIINLYGQWYNAGFEYGREEYVKQSEKIKKQGYVDGLKKHVRKTNIPKEYEQIYRTEYEKGREKYVENIIEKFRKHKLKIKVKYEK